MGHVPHELHEVFHQDAEALQRLKQDNHHFRLLAERHHAINREIHRIEAGIDPASDDRFAGLKHQRLVILDEVAAMIAQLKVSG
jgi:uncharacterized protein YdcH (DUF465 family)